MLLVLRLDHLTSNTPIARSSAGGITIMPSFRKAPAPTVWAFTAQRRKPQDGGEGAGERKARPKVDTDQDSACDPLGHVSVLHCGAREQTGRQVIDQVAHDSNDKLIECFHDERNFFVGNAAAMSVLSSRQLRLGSK